MYERGQGVPQDYSEAMRLYKGAAERGDAAAQYRIGDMYRRGKCVERDYAEAVKWYLMAADRTQGGNAHVQAHA